MKVKVCGLTDDLNITELAKVQPDYMGFIFYSKSIRKLVRQEVVKQNYPGIKKVGVFVNEKIDIIIDLIEKCKLDIIQLHGNESPQYCRELQTDNIEIIKAFAIDDAFDFSTTNPYENSVHYFLFDTKGKKHGGNGQHFNWIKLNEYRGETPFFLSGGIGPSDVNRIKSINHNQLIGVDINSQFEIEPGMKNINLVQKFVNELKGITKSTNYQIDSK